MCVIYIFIFFIVDRLEPILIRVYIYINIITDKENISKRTIWFRNRNYAIRVTFLGFLFGIHRMKSCKKYVYTWDIYSYIDIVIVSQKCCLRNIFFSCVPIICLTPHTFNFSYFFLTLSNKYINKFFFYLTDRVGRKNLKEK